MTTIQVKRFTLEEYHKLTEIGFFHEDDHIQLINGELIEMASKGTVHETCLRNLWKLFPQLIGNRATLQSQAAQQLTTQKRTRTRFCNYQKPR